MRAALLMLLFLADGTLFNFMPVFCRCAPRRGLTRDWRRIAFISGGRLSSESRRCSSATASPAEIAALSLTSSRRESEETSLPDLRTNFAVGRLKISSSGKVGSSMNSSRNSASSSKPAKRLLDLIGRGMFDAKSLVRGPLSFTGGIFDGPAMLGRLELNIEVAGDTLDRGIGGGGTALEGIGSL